MGGIESTPDVLETTCRKNPDIAQDSHPAGQQCRQIRVVRRWKIFFSKSLAIDAQKADNTGDGSQQDGGRNAPEAHVVPEEFSLPALRDAWGKSFFRGFRRPPESERERRRGCRHAA
ncbi:MAG: hypothetical protein LBR22_05095 [Desulfovibrio sp.]|jgi:hypothetical protein|nr:hypothetical protein [Desulfovibrio sp.]